MEQRLIVEDDQALNQGLCKALKTEGRQLISCQRVLQNRRKTRKIMKKYAPRSERKAFPYL